MMQNDSVLDENGNYIDSDDPRFHVFFIMTGNYSVQSLMFDVKKQLTEKKSLEDDDTAAAKKNLRAGDYFGEVSIIFGCRRTATIKAK